MILALALVVSASADTRRFALIAGANNGGPDRVTLQYAVTDADAIGGVLADLGGIPRSNQTVLVEPDADVLREAIDNLSNTVSAAEARGMRTEVVFYYSGHSDEGGLMLGESLYPFPELKRHLEGIPSDVKVVILDSCASGAMVRTKGGVARPAFLEDRTNDVEGTAYVMSSAADEASQESDVVGASYFTHFLVSGMRGAADRSLDGRVTLHEAWDFASRETLERTERTSIGAQHPFFHRDLGGHGDFVFTDLTQTTSSLVFDASLDGRLFVRDADGDLVAELAKPADESVEVALGAGLYTVVLQRGAERSEAVFDIGEAEHMMVDDLEFTPIEAEEVRARGGARPSEVVARPAPPRPPPPAPKPRSKRVKAQFDMVPDALDVNYQLGIAGTRAHTLVGAQTSIFVNVADDARGVQMAGMTNVANQKITGVQAGPINVSQELLGAQIGFINHSKKARGVQLGLVNSGGDGQGLQVGLINVAKDYQGASLGLLTLHKNGYNHFFASGGAPEHILLELSFGSRYVYTKLQTGSAFTHGGSASFGGAFGLHIPVRKFYVDVESGGGYRVGRYKAREETSTSSGVGAPFVRIRSQFGYAFAKRFALQLGPIVEWNDPGRDLDGVDWRDVITIGMTAGIRL